MSECFEPEIQSCQLWLQKKIDELTGLANLRLETIRRLEAEIARLKKLIDDAATHWLSDNLGISFEGAIDGAMKAAIDEIKSLRKDVAKLDMDVARIAEERDKANEIIKEQLDHSADGVLLCTYKGKLYCPNCHNVVEEHYDICNCWACTNPDNYNQRPLPLFYTQVLTK